MQLPCRERPNPTRNNAQRVLKRKWAVREPIFRVNRRRELLQLIGFPPIWLFRDQAEFLIRENPQPGEISRCVLPKHPH